MTVEAGNRMIAEFRNIPKCDRCQSDCGTYKFGNSIYYAPIEMQYHSSWDWLMPVWAKIQNIGADLGSSFKHHWERFHVGIDKGDVRTCFDVIVEFLEWYLIVKVEKR